MANGRRGGVEVWGGGREGAGISPPLAKGKVAFVRQAVGLS